MNKIIETLKKRLAKFKKQRIALEKKMKRSCDTEVEMDFCNLEGHIEELETILLTLKELKNA
jgi:Rad3-related DNA helicase